MHVDVWIVSDDEKMAIVSIEVLEVPGRPGDQLLVKSEPLTTSTPNVDERLRRTAAVCAVVCNRQVQLSTKHARGFGEGTMTTESSKNGAVTMSIVWIFWMRLDKFTKY